MKRRTAVIAVLVSLMPIGQPLVIGIATAVIFSVPQRALAESAIFYFNRAIDKRDEGDYYGAISDYNKAIEINPNYAFAYYNRGNIKGRDLEDYSGALSDLNQAIEIDPNYDQMYISRCLVKDRLKDYYGAISDCNKAIEINPKDAQAYINRGVSKFRIGDKKGACFDARQGKSLGSSNGSKAVELLCK